MLIKCPECKKEISDKAKSCPNCGYDFDYDDFEEETESKESTLSILSLVVFVCGLLTMGFTGYIVVVFGTILAIFAYWKSEKAVCANIVFWLTTAVLILNFI